MNTDAGKLPPAVASGEVCAWCMVAFVQAHGKPVYCTRCYQRALATRKSLIGLLPVAWLKERGKNG